jgi:hypothetical protein
MFPESALNLPRKVGRIGSIAWSLPVLLLAGCAGMVTGPLPSGTWGGEGIRLDVTRSGGSLELDCAGGTVFERILLEEGEFEAAGTFTLERGGPVREGEPPDTRGASYSGVLRGDLLTLLVSVEGLPDPVGPFRLRRGAQALLRKCL